MSKFWALAGLLFGLTAFGSVGYHQGDEHFQILEFANYKLGLSTAEDLPWEFDARMRPALQPAMAYGVYRLLGGVGVANPFTVALLLRLLSAALTLSVAWLVYRRYRPVVPSKLHPFWVVLLLFHWCAYYNGVRFSSENWSGLAAVVGLLTYPLARLPERRCYTPEGGSRALVSGVCFGLAFLFRYQAGLLAAGFGLWLLVVRREHWLRVVKLVLGGLLILGLAYPLTYWLYGEWTLPAYNYFVSNLVQGKAATYGTRPWYGYFELVFLRGIPPLSLLYILGTLVYCYVYRRDPVTWMVVVFLVVHSLIARKDVRFLFPLIPLLPVLLIGAAQVIVSRYERYWSSRWVRITAIVLLVLNLLLLNSVILRRAATGTGPAEFIYEHYPEPVTLVGPEAYIFLAEGAAPRFYLRPGTQFNPVPPDSLGTCGPAPCLYVAHTRSAPVVPDGAKLVYLDRTALIDALNFFGWADREKWWYVYGLPED